jgi:hypothetical protein
VQPQPTPLADLLDLMRRTEEAGRPYDRVVTRALSESQAAALAATNVAIADLGPAAPWPDDEPEELTCP